MPGTSSLPSRDLSGRVVVADVLEEKGRAVAAELGERGRFARLDVSDPEGWQRLMEALDGWPPVRILVNNAAIHRTRLIEEEVAGDVRRMLDVNVVGPTLGIQAVIPSMRRAGGGSIVNVCSVRAVSGGRSTGSYTASKWALRGLTRTAALELAEDGIRVNAVHPGYIETEMLAASAAAQSGDDAYAFLPMGRAGTPEEAASVVLFLASDDSSYVSGADIVVDGAWMAGSGPRIQRASAPA
jgi:3alpha(or 20beta)-hydroxysteroid dehydrogenase